MSEMPTPHELVDIALRMPRSDVDWKPDYDEHGDIQACDLFLVCQLLMGEYERGYDVYLSLMQQLANRGLDNDEAQVRRLITEVDRRWRQK